MKIFSKTFIFGTLVTALALYVIWDFTELKKKGDLRDNEVLLGEDLIGDEIIGLQIKKGTEIIQFKFDSGKCLIAAPVEDSCDVTVVQNIVNLVQDLKGVPLKESISAEEMGLAGDQGTVYDLSLKGGRHTSYRIGEKNTFDGKIYVQKDSQYFLTDSTTAQLTNKGLAQVRNPFLWRSLKKAIEMDEVRVEYLGKSSEPSYVLVKSSDNWELKEPKDERSLQQEKVSKWLESTDRTKVAEFLSPDKRSSVKPTMRMKFLKAGKEEYILEFSEADSLAVDSLSPRVMKLSEKSSQDLFVPVAKLFDGQKAFQFSMEEAAHLYVTKGGATDHFKKEEDRWAYEGPKKSFQEVKLPEFFSQLRHLEAQTYAKPQKWFGLDSKSQRRIRVTDKDGKSIFDMTWGEKLKPDLQYVYVEGQKFVFGVNQVQLNSLLTFDLFNPAKDEGHGEDHHHEHSH